MIYVKRRIRWIIKNRITILQISLLAICVTVPTIILIPAGKPKIIASLVSLNLNGEINEDLQAQILIENLTTHEWEENVQLLNLIEDDMVLLTNQIQGLDKITIYNYSSSSLPGKVNLFLENIRFREKKYLNELNNIIEADREKWWYIEEFSFTSILEEAGIVDAYNFNYCGNYANFYLLFFEHPQHHDDNVTLQSNETIVASWWVEESGNWTFNEGFLDVIEKEIFSLNNSIVGIESFSSYIDRNDTEVNTFYPILYNLTEPIPREYAEHFGELQIKINLSKDSSRTARNAALKVFLKVVMSKWYIQDYMIIGPCDFGPDMIRYIFGLFLAVPVCSVVFLIFSLRLLRKIIKKVDDRESFSQINIEQ